MNRFRMTSYTFITFICLATSGCKQRKASCPTKSLAQDATKGFQVVGGQEDAQSLPKTLRVYVQKKDRAELCSGVFISDRTLLTAGHCLKDAVLVRVSGEDTFFASSNLTSTNIELHPSYEEDIVEDGSGQRHRRIGLGQIWADLGLVHFNAGSVPEYLVGRLADHGARPSDPVQLAGYGSDSHKSAHTKGIKRYGTNQVAYIFREYNDAIGMKGLSDLFNAPEPNANQISTGSGDSGAPLYNGSGQILGLLSSVILPDTAGAEAISLFVNLARKESFSFIAPHVAGRIPATLQGLLEPSIDQTGTAQSAEASIVEEESSSVQHSCEIKI